MGGLLCCGQMDDLENPKKSDGDPPKLSFFFNVDFVDFRKRLNAITIFLVFLCLVFTGGGISFVVAMGPPILNATVYAEIAILVLVMTFMLVFCFGLLVFKSNWYLNIILLLLVVFFVGFWVGCFSFVLFRILFLLE